MSVSLLLLLSHLKSKFPIGGSKNLVFNIIYVQNTVRHQLETVSTHPPSSKGRSPFFSQSFWPSQLTSEPWIHQLLLQQQIGQSLKKKN